jgi:MFS family permease
MCYAVFYACTEPAEKTLVASLAGTERKGLAYGWYNFAIGIGALPASLLFGFLYQQFGVEFAFGFSVTLALLSALLLTMVRPRGAELDTAIREGYPQWSRGPQAPR